VFGVLTAAVRRHDHLVLYANVYPGLVIGAVRGGRRAAFSTVGDSDGRREARGLRPRPTPGSSVTGRHQYHTHVTAGASTGARPRTDLAPIDAG